VNLSMTCPRPVEAVTKRVEACRRRDEDESNMCDENYEGIPGDDFIFLFYSFFFMFLLGKR
jgi:hypothetical protein